MTVILGLAKPYQVHQFLERAVVVTHEFVTLFRQIKAGLVSGIRGNTWQPDQRRHAEKNAGASPRLPVSGAKRGYIHPVLLLSDGSLRLFELSAYRSPRQGCRICGLGQLFADDGIVRLLEQSLDHGKIHFNDSASRSSSRLAMRQSCPFRGQREQAVPLYLLAPAGPICRNGIYSMDDSVPSVAWHAQLFAWADRLWTSPMADRSGCGA